MNNLNLDSCVVTAKQIINQVRKTEESVEDLDPNGFNLFMYKWGDKVKDYSSVYDLLDLIDESGDGLEESLNSLSSIDDWFNAYLCTDDFASMSVDRKRMIIKSKDAVKWLIGQAVDFLSDNQLSVYKLDN